MIKNIIFDFDGVILDSVPIKTEAYKKLFNEYDKRVVAEFIKYHELNGGISRYEKIKYFFQILLKQEILEKDILKLANIYSILTKKELSNSKYLIKETIAFIKDNYLNFNMHIASGADDNDLKYICNKLNLNKYFISITGSPTLKSEIVNKIIVSNNYDKNETILIGDSLNDYNAAEKNNILFYGFNNRDLKSMGNYIHSFRIVYF